MTFQQIQKREYIWAYMYGKPTIDYFDGRVQKDKLIKISTKQLNLWKNGQQFDYVWGWPGPDYNLYNISDYKTTWCFDPSEIPNAELYHQE